MNKLKALLIKLLNMIKKIKGITKDIVIKFLEFLLAKLKDEEKQQYKSEKKEIKTDNIKNDNTVKEEKREFVIPEIKVPKTEKKDQVDFPVETPQKDKVDTPVRTPQKDNVNTPVRTQKREQTIVEPQKIQPEKETIEKKDKEKEHIKVEVGPVINTETPSLKPEVHNILFKDIDDFENVIDGFINQADYINENLNIDEEDKEIYLEYINRVKKQLIKFKNSTLKKIQNEDIDEDDYSEIVTYKFIKLLEDDYRQLLQTSISNFDHNKNKKYQDAIKVIESLVLNNGFEKYEITEKFLSPNLAMSNTIITLDAKNKENDNLISEVLTNPYFVYLIEDDEEKKVYLKGKIIVQKYKGN